MTWCAYYRGKKIPYWLGALIGFDIFINSCWPGAHVQHTISERIGRKRVKLAIRAGAVLESEVFLPDGRAIPWERLPQRVQVALAKTRIPFCRHPLEAVIDAGLEQVDQYHSLEAIGP